jgi:hypothetical protein
MILLQDLTPLKVLKEARAERVKEREAVAAGLLGGHLQ